MGEIKKENMYIKFLVVLPREPRINDFEMKDAENRDYSIATSVTDS